MYTLRPHQQEGLDALYDWWIKKPAIAECPILSYPTGAGKSIIIAELVRLLFDTWPEDHPRTLVLVPSKELAEQNAEKLSHILPAHLTIGYYSASLGKKRPDADVIVATIGSVAKAAHVLGNIKCVIIDECHLVNPDGAGQYRQLLNDLAKYCAFRVVGMTATPFRGNGVWLTSGKQPLFTGIAYECKVQRLLDDGFLSPLIRPFEVMQTRIETNDISITNGDFNVDELALRVDQYIEGGAVEAAELAKDRHKWIAFTPTVATAHHLAEALNRIGIQSAVVCGSTAKKERETLINQLRTGRLRCLVTVLALATGFDVPDIDCILWFRPTKSPVLYVQGAGRGLRIAHGKTDCLWLDFSDTTERLGPVDAIRGRKKTNGGEARDAPYAICPECGAQVRPASLLECPDCGAILREPEPETARSASNSAIMASQIAPKINTYEVTDVKYRAHHKEGSPDSLRVDYWSGFRVVASEWVCLFHKGFAGEKAFKWWLKFIPQTEYPVSIESAVGLCFNRAIRPASVTVDETGKYASVLGVTF